LETASKNTGVDVQLTWEPFFLNPNMPAEGEDLMMHLRKKYGDSVVQRFGGSDNPLSKAGRACSPSITFKQDRFIYPTNRAHAVMEYLKANNARAESNMLMRVFFRQYFEEGLNINSNEVIKAAIDEVKPNEPEKVLAAADDKDLVDLVSTKDAEFKNKMRVSGVPFFIIHRNDGGRATGFSGAQPPDLLGEQLEDAATE
jgi:predicted DsbA family dithiol-disulfide isomerase